MNPFHQIVVVAGAGLGGLLLGYWLSQKRQENQLPKSDEFFIEPIFFPDSAVDTVSNLSKAEREQIYKQILVQSPSLLRIIEYLSLAEKSVDVCIYHFTNYDLGTAVLNSIKKKAKIRLLCDYDSEVVAGSQVGRFRSAGAFVRTKHQQYIMHHKFAIIDEKILVTGSFNWTMTAAMGNRENVIVTNHPETVRRFKEEFEKLWEEYAPE